ncbi:MAG TPA: FAD-dependent monooxygenase [Polyangia bacterium]|jgi:2-polyprenyl-6-methoxyphenol hydroxylase-like FAD-dependent oxidoreductase|nr:FAD-dependent monooxygenase [Polyangia bacterium]
MADVLIAGAGPAGASLAIMLGRAGLSVELYDARTFPREKPCGEGIMPAGVAVLGRLGLLDAVGGTRVLGVRYHGWGLAAESRFPPIDGAPATMLAQRRLRLDAALVTAARATPGVRVFEDAAVEGAVVERGRAVGLRVGGDLRRAGLVVGADGLGSRVRRSLGLDARARASSAARVGLRAHFRLAAGQIAPDHVEIFVAGKYEIYVAPLPEREVLVAALSGSSALGGQARGTMARWIAETPRLAALLDGAERLTDVAGRAPVTGRARAGFAPGAVLLGDAARATDPLTAGGLCHALVTAERLAAIVPRALGQGEADAALRRFDRDRRRLLRAPALLTDGLLALVRRPALARATLRLMRASPRVMQGLLGVAAGI